MKVFGSISRLVSLLFRKNGQDVTLRPSQSTTYTAARDVQLPPGDADHVLVGAASTQTLSNKTIDAASNTLSNIADANISASAAIAYSKLSIADGDLTIAKTSGLQSALDGKVDDSQLGANNGVATLDANGKLTNSQIPAIAITDTFVAADQTAMLALSAQTGDVAVRTDLSKSFILKGTDPTVLGDWQELLTPTSAVTSVNGQTGTVSLDSDDVAEGSTNLYFTDGRVDTRTATYRFAATWASGDGTSKTVTHNLGSTDVRVELYEIDSGETVMVDSVTRSSGNAVALTASEAPSGSGWKVLVSKA